MGSTLRAMSMECHERKLLNNGQKYVVGYPTVVFLLSARQHDRQGELSRTLESVPFINVHELGSMNMKDPAKLAKHASFLGAHMMTVVSEVLLRDKFFFSVLANA